MNTQWHETTADGILGALLENFWKINGATPGRTP